MSGRLAAWGAAIVLITVAAASRGGLLPTPPPFAEMLTEEGTKRGAERVPSSVAASGNGGGSGRRPAVATGQPRFFFAGNGHLVLKHAHFAEGLDVHYRHADGTYDPAALAAIRHFFRSREDGREAPISLRLIELLSYIQQRYQPRQMTLLSGFRSPQFNADLRAAGQQVAQASLHTEGLAADVAFSGLGIARLWRQLRALHTGGAGYYRTGRFLHIDSGPPRFWEETTSRVGEDLSAGNARVFVRSDFDRYAGLQGAVLSLHSITAFPLSIAAEGRLASPDASSAMTIEALDGGGIERRDGCFVITAPLAAYQFRVVSAPPHVEPRGRSQLMVSTCEPRVGKTPADIVSNEIEVMAP